jgi:hypothetical protein
MTELYPKLPAQEMEGGGTSFRLQKISELQRQLEGERDARAALYKKYRRGVNAADGLDATLATVSLATGAGGIALLTTVVAAPVVVALEVTAVACGLAGIGCKYVSRKLQAKTRKHDEIRVLAETKLNTVSDHISHALKDNDISDEEFRMVLDEAEKYQEMKQGNRAKAVHAFAAVRIDEAEKTRLIAQGREEARVDIVKAVGGHSH